MFVIAPVTTVITYKGIEYFVIFFYWIRHFYMNVKKKGFQFIGLISKIWEWRYLLNNFDINLNYRTQSFLSKVTNFFN